MGKKLFIIILIVWCKTLNAQKTEISYGGYLGINNSFLTSKAFISNDYLNSDPAYVRNLSFQKNPRVDFGYDLGVFIKAQPENSRMSLKTGLQIANYNNTYALTVSWEQYYATTGNYWGKIVETEKISNEFNIIHIPLIAGYDIIQNDTYRISFFCGASSNINMNDGHIKYDYPMQELHLYKDFYMSYQSGISMSLKNISTSIKYDRSLNIKETRSRDYFPYSMNVEKLYMNLFSISLSIKLNQN